MITDEFLNVWTGSAVVRWLRGSRLLSSRARDVRWCKHVICSTRWRRRRSCWKRCWHFTARRVWSFHANPHVTLFAAAGDMNSSVEIEDFRLRKVTSKQQAREIAASACAFRGWPFVEPVLVSWRPFTYRVWTNASSRGGNVLMRIRKRDGDVFKALVMPK